MKHVYKFGVAAAFGMMLIAPVTSAKDLNIGVAMANFDDNFLTNVRNAISAKAKETPGVKVQFEDAQADIGRQVNQVQNFIAKHVDAIIINPADTTVTTKITKMVSDSGIPLVYVNRAPDSKNLPPKVAVVASNHSLSGRLEMEELAKKMGGKGNLVIMMAELSANHTRERTAAYKEVLKKYPGIKVIEEQTANSRRSQAIDLMNKWLAKGDKIDGVVANDDEMALGALLAIKQAGLSPKKIKVAGIDATHDGLAEMAKGNLAADVFQNAKAQGAGALDAAVKLATGKKVDPFIWVPYELVTDQNYKQYMNK